MISFIHICKPPMLHTKLHIFPNLATKLITKKAWGLNPLFLLSGCILLNNITKITDKCLVVINGPII